MDASNTTPNGCRITPLRPDGRGGNLGHKDGAPNGEVGIWVWRMATGGKDQTRKIQIKRERQKRQESKLAAKTEWQRGGRAESGTVKR